MGMVRFNQFMPERQVCALRQVHDLTDLSTAEVLRRMVDYCSREPVIGELVPSVSGCAILGGR